MKDKIREITDVINNKSHDLANKVERFFSGIDIPSDSSAPVPVRKKSTPPIAYLLYGVAGLSAIGGFCSDETSARVMCFGAAAASAYGGWRFGQKASCPTTSNNERVNINSLKNDITAKVLDSVKRTKSEWETFMETQQNDLQSFIQNSDLNAEKKDSMMSKIFVYEVLDINMSDFNNRMRDVSDIAMLRSVINTFKLKMKQAIDSATQKQIEKYKSLVA